MSKIAIYPGTFDPITNGHINLIDRALNIFDQIIVAVSTAYGKDTLFDISTRELMIKEVFKKNKKIKIINFKGLLIDIAIKNNVFTIIRGLRSISDFDYEYKMSLINNKLHNNIQTIFLTSDENFSCISSTLIKSIAIHNYKYVDKFVPKCVLDKIKIKYSKDYGITNY